MDQSLKLNSYFRFLYLGNPPVKREKVARKPSRIGAYFKGLMQDTDFMSYFGGIGCLVAVMGINLAIEYHSLPAIPETIAATNAASYEAIDRTLQQPNAIAYAAVDSINTALDVVTYLNETLVAYPMRP